MKKNLEMMSSNIIKENIDYIANKFPNALKEVIEDGKVVKKIDFDVLKQELSTVVIDDRQERYQMTWPDKKKSILLANSRINGTLRPVKEKSVDFENTKNLYIEGDNLDVLKLLRETYLGKIKMIYIDPPYNTGTDLVYEDDFAQSSEEYLSNSGQFDEQGNRLIQNTDSKGRFHTDWLNMMYPRLKIAKDLLSDDGVIFISIDENEIKNLLYISDELFNVSNRIGTVVWKNRTTPNDSATNFATTHEYVLIYAKNSNNVVFKGKKKSLSNYKNPDDDPKGNWIADNPSAASGSERDRFPIENPFTGQIYYPPKGRYWAFSEKRVKEWFESGKLVFPKENNKNFLLKKYASELKSLYLPNGSIYDEVLTMHGTKEFRNLFPDYPNLFKYPKPSQFIKELISFVEGKDFYVLDFFSGSATTADAVNQLNFADNGNRKYILIQLQETIDEEIVGEKTQFDNICDVGQERIRRAGKTIKREAGILGQEIDLGFRVLKLDSSNMNDVYYNPKDIKQDLLEQLVGNIKEDRTPLDLLFQVMLELGIELSAKIEEKELLGKKYFIVNENDIVACFDDGISDKIVSELAKIKPIYVVFKDSSFESDSANINSEQIFKTISPSTRIRVI